MEWTLPCEIPKTLKRGHRPVAKPRFSEGIFLEVDDPKPDDSCFNPIERPVADEPNSRRQGNKEDGQGPETRRQCI